MSSVRRESQEEKKIKDFTAATSSKLSSGFLSARVTNPLLEVQLIQAKL